MKIKVGIVGGTGYTGVELLRILVNHPQVEIEVVTSRSDAGVRVDLVYPNFHGLLDVCFTEPNIETLAECNVVFFATPNGTAMWMTDALLTKGVKVIDLSADFRIINPKIWAKWYGQEHACPDLIEKAVYGLPEINRESIKSADLIACPGCYPTAVQLGFLPLIEKGLIDLSQLIADVKSGVSGAGRKAQVGSLMSETGESFKAYAVTGHRHLPEITQSLEQIAECSINLTFVPHLVPMIRGIHATLYAQLDAEYDELQTLFEKRYQNEGFVDVLPQGSYPDTRNVRGGNRCQIAVHKPQNGRMVVVLSVIDNLVKGAAGQAVQNMNLMFGFEEKTALDIVALYP